MTFQELGLNESIIKGLELQGIDTPTTVQEQSVSKILENRNLIIQSETGSGKTLAYLLPIFEREDPSVRIMHAIIVVPTHELAIQVHRQVEMLSKNSGIALKSAVIFGGVNIKSQIEVLREKPQIIIGTTGRIIELIRQKKISAHTIKTIVIDEADKMLSIDNIDRIKTIVKSVMRDTQIVMVSASVSAQAINLAKEIAKNSEIIKTTKALKIPENIQHKYIVVEERDKIDTLRKLIYILKPNRAMAFINNATEIDIATQKLKYHQLKADCIQGASSKEQRNKALTNFAEGKLQLLIATDIASRGLHIEDVEIIFSVSISEDPLDYLHRSGRTGRGNSNGLSISIISKRDLPIIKICQSTFGISMTEIKMSHGEIKESTKQANL